MMLILSRNLPRLIIRSLLLLLGSILLLFAAYDFLLPRARYVSSSPQPGASLAGPPGAVAVSFSEELATTSEITVASTITFSPSGETQYADGQKFTAAGPDPVDPQRRTLRADLKPADPRGLYWVQWKAVAARGKAERFGTFCFGIGMQVPAHIVHEVPGALREWNYDERRRRAVLVGGVLLVALGALLPRLPWSGPQLN